MVSVKNRFPLPVLSDLLHSSGKNKITLDCLSGFWQIPLDEQSRPFTASSTLTGHWQFVCMPVRLHSSPITFSGLMTNLFHYVIRKEVMVYLDNIVSCLPISPPTLTGLEVSWPSCMRRVSSSSCPMLVFTNVNLVSWPCGGNRYLMVMIDVFMMYCKVGSSSG